MAQLIKNWVIHCKQCIRESRIGLKLTRLPLQNPIEQIIAPEDAMKIDLFPALHPSGSYGDIVTAMDVLSRSLFGYTTSKKDAKTIAKVKKKHTD